MGEPGTALTDRLAGSLEGAGIPLSELKGRIAARAAGRPEAALFGAFVGGLIVAMVLRRLGG